MNELPTKEEALAEIQRRLQMPSVEEAKAEIQRRQQAYSPTTMSLKDIFSHVIREQAKRSLSQTVSPGILPGQEAMQKIGYGAIPATESFLPGLIHSLQSGVAGISGQQQPGALQSNNEYGSGFGSMAGEITGDVLKAAPGAIVGGLAGGPVGAIIGSGLSTAATTPGGAPERALAGGVTMALPAAGKVIGSAAKKAMKLPDLIKNLSAKVHPEKALETARSRHDILRGTAEELFNYTKDEMKKRGITEIPISKNILENIEQYMPKTPEHKKLFEKAASGDPEAIHDLQSFLWKKGTKAMSNTDPAVNAKGEEMLAWRKQLNDNVQNQLIQKGHTDLTHSYKQGQKLWNELKKTYYDYNKIAKIFDPELQKIPSDIIKTFSEISKPMRDFLKIHPEIEQEILKAQAKEQAKKELMKTGAITAGIIGSEHFDLGPSRLLNMLVKK